MEHIQQTTNRNRQINRIYLRRRISSVCHLHKNEITDKMLEFHERNVKKKKIIFIYSFGEEPAEHKKK